MSKCISGGITQQSLDQELDIQTPKVGTTYDELRRLNRQEYDRKNNVPIYQ